MAHWYGAAVLLPTDALVEPLLRTKSTLLTVPSESEAAASQLEPFTGAVSVAPASGFRIDTVGAMLLLLVVPFWMLTLTCALVDAPAESYATARSTWVPFENLVVSRLHCHGA